MHPWSTRINVLIYFFKFKLRHLTDLHSVHSSSLTALFAHSTLDLKQVDVPGPKSKAKKGNRIFEGFQAIYGPQSESGFQYNLIFLRLSLQKEI